jgi:ABC-type dipeptide/oligopeptide/nickel transport system ATPase subunit
VTPGGTRTLVALLRAVSLDPELALSDAQRAALPGVIRAHVGLE